MIDWFASKMGLLIFVMAATAMLLAFFFVQSDVYSGAQAANSATDIARLIESVDEGVTVSYAMNIGNYKLDISADHLNLNGFVRYFFVAAKTSSVTNEKKIVIMKRANEQVLVCAPDLDYPDVPNSCPSNP